MVDDTDSMETTGGTADSGSIEDTDSSDDESTDVDTDSEEDENLCVGLTQTECGGIVAEDGDAECAFNAVTGDCYEIERREGRMGSGNFDDGYNKAKQQADDAQAQLELLVAVLGGVIGLLVLVIIGGAIYVYRKGQNGKDAHHHLTNTSAMGVVDAVDPVDASADDRLMNSL